MRADEDPILAAADAEVERLQKLLDEALDAREEAFEAWMAANPREARMMGF